MSGVAVACLAATGFAAPSWGAASAAERDRIAGTNRYLTAVEISKRHFPNGTWPGNAPVQVVTVASGTDYPDALAGGPFAAGLGPLLLVPAAGTVPAGVLNEIKRLSPDSIVVLGGLGAVNAAVEGQLKPLAPTVRISGANRFDTAAQIATATSKDLGGAGTVVLTSGEDFADSLGGGASAAVQSGVLMLTRPLGLPTETAAALRSIKPPTVQILGGPLVVSEAVVTQVKAAVPGASVTRVFGPARADTAAALSKATFPGSETSEVFLTSGSDYPDALAAAPLAWFWNASVLLSRPGCAPAATVSEDARIAPDHRSAIGGPSVVSDAALNLTPCG